MFYKIFIDMKNRIIITESQYKRLMKTINEESTHSLAVKQLKKELNASYMPVNKYVRKGGVYNDVTMIKNLIDDEEISVKSLRDFLKDKFKLEDNDFIEQVIRDWVSGKGLDEPLSKNIPLK